MAQRIGIIGGGNMGGAIVRGGITAGVFKAHDVIVAEIDSTRREFFEALGCVVTDQPEKAAAAEQIILAVKPQAFAKVAEAIAPLPDKIVLSIMAGLSSDAIRRALGGKCRVVRAMPNTPCQIGEGMTAIALGAGAKEGDERLAQSIFSALGRTVMADESLMYAITAISGSGPAYIFLLAEAMEQAAGELGIDPSTARLLVMQTVRGTGKLLSESDQSAAELRQAVASPGGTTAAALDVFHDRRFIEIIVEALTAARDRGRQLDSQ